MADKTGIEWTDATWNPTTGCTKVSSGCKHCYAERDWARLVHLPAYAGRSFTDVACHPDRLDQPLRWQKPRMIFVNSMSDLFHESIPDEFIARVLTTTIHAQQHTFQILTKRPERMRDVMRRWTDMNGRAQRNLWLGVSIEDQASADERIPLLLQTPAAVRWISAEPLLGSVSMRWMAAFPESAPYTAQHPSGRTDHLDGLRRLDWVVVGGESGPNARPMNPAWVRSIRDQCVSAGVPFLLKQWGEWGDPASIEAVGTAHNGWWEINPEDGGVRRHEFDNQNEVFRVGKKHAGRLLDGVQRDGYPEIVR